MICVVVALEKFMTALDLARKHHHEKIALAIEKRKIAAEAAVEAAEIAEHIGAAPTEAASAQAKAKKSLCL